MEIQYACIAAFEDGKTRCRRTAEPGSQFCWQHRERAIVVPPPDGVLLKPKVNPYWFGMLADEIPLISEERKEEKIQAHITQAKKLGREAFTLRKTIEDSGTSVFRGMKDDEFVSISELLQELLDEGYFLTNIHGKPAQNKPMWVLTIGFFRKVEQMDHSVLKLIESDLAKAVLGVILGSVWQYCHIWANPPDEKGRVIHTVNLAHRHQQETPAKKLKFYKGLWKLK